MDYLLIAVVLRDSFLYESKKGKRLINYAKTNSVPWPSVIGPGGQRKVSMGFNLNPGCIKLCRESIKFRFN